MYKNDFIISIKTAAVFSRFLFHGIRQYLNRHLRFFHDISA
jgi:hypothetical protein